MCKIRDPLILVLSAPQITFQVKRVRKPKAESADGWIQDEGFHQGTPSAGHSILEISGPTIPSPGPAGTLLSLLVSKKKVQSIYSQFLKY